MAMMLTFKFLYYFQGQCAPGKSFCCYNRPGGFSRPGPAINPLTGRPIHNIANGVLAGPGGPVDHLPGHKTNPDNAGDGSSTYPVLLGFGNGFQSIDEFHNTNGIHNTNGFKPINGFHNIKGFQPVNGFQNRNGFIPIIPVNSQNNCNNNNNNCNGGGGNTNQVDYGNCNNNGLTSHAFNNINGLALNNNKNIGLNHNSGSNRFQASSGVNGIQENSEKNGLQNNSGTVLTTNAFQGQNGIKNSYGAQREDLHKNGVSTTASSIGLINNNNRVAFATGLVINNQEKSEFYNKINFNNEYRNTHEVGIGVTVSTGLINNNNGGQSEFHNNNGGKNVLNNNNNEGQNGLQNNNNNRQILFINNNVGQNELTNNYVQNRFNNDNGGHNEFNNNNNNGQSGVNNNNRVTSSNIHPNANGFGIAGTINTNINNVGMVAGSAQGSFQETFVMQGNNNGMKPNINIHQTGGDGFGITEKINGGWVGVNIDGHGVGVTISPVVSNHNTGGFNTVQPNNGVGIENFQNNFAIVSNPVQNHVTSVVSNFLNTNALGINSIQENFGSTTNFQQNNHVNTNSVATNVFQNNNVHNVNGVQGDVDVNVFSTQGNRETGIVNIGFGPTVGNEGTRVNVVPGVNFGFGVNRHAGNVGISTKGVNIIPGVVGFRINGHGGTIGNRLNLDVSGTGDDIIPGVNVRYRVNGNGGTIANAVNLGLGETGINVVPEVKVGHSGTETNFKYEVNMNKGTIANVVNHGLGGTGVNVVSGVNIGFGDNGNEETFKNEVNVGAGGTRVNVEPEIHVRYGVNAEGINVGLGETGVNVGYEVNGNGNIIGNEVNIGVSGTRVNIVPAVNSGVYGNGGNGDNRGIVPIAITANNGLLPITLPLIPAAQNGAGALKLKLRINSGSNISNSVHGTQPYFNGSNGKPITFRVIGARFGPPKPGGVRLFNGSRAAYIRQNGPNGYRTIDDREYARPLFQMDWLNGMAKAFNVFYRIIS